MALRSSWIRLGIPIVLLLACASGAGVLAWHEGERARATAQVLMRDYASFIADKFVILSALRYQALTGIQAQAYDATAPFAVLRSFAQQRAQDPAAVLPPPIHGVADYYFLVDREAGTLRFSGTAPPAEERERLMDLVLGITLKCTPNDVLAYGRLDALGDPGAAPRTVWYPWSGILEFDSRGEVRRIYGLRLNIGFALDRILVPVLTEAQDCDCVSSLLPGSLSAIRDPRLAAWFIIRDAQGAARFESAPSYRDADGVRRDLSATMPLRGWTVEVVVNPSVIRPLLPYGGRGAPWPALGLIAALIIGAAILGVAALRGENKLFRLREEFVSNVSHELKTPLSRIRLFNELLSKGSQPDAAKRSHYHEVIDRECRRFTVLVENILDFARTGRGAAKQEVVRLDLKKILEEALDTFRGTRDQERLKLEAHLEPVGDVLGNADALQQMLINLLDNAEKYSPDGSPIEVRLASDDGKGKLEVSDHGCGIPEEEHEQIFEPFYRAPAAAGTESKRPAGSGLGLALVRRTVTAHGGTVEVRSTPGLGSTFSITLPLAHDRSGE
jgi:signal transduction histidine kinase